MKITSLIKNIAASEHRYPDEVFSLPGRTYTCVNSYAYLFARKDIPLYDRMDGIFVDGMWLCKFLRIFWGKKITRRSFDMTSMARDLFERLNAPDNNQSIYFLGSRPEQVKAATELFARSYPGMKIAGCRDGYFKSDEERIGAARAIVSLTPDFAIMGMGKPAQEQFACLLREQGFKGIIFTCGGFLHQSTQKLHYYPKWIDRMNLRAFYRFYKEGTWIRLFYDLFRFPPLFIFDTLSSKLSKK